MTRSCGTCRLCCKVFPLPVLDKPGDAWCRFACDAGCAIHDDGIPAVCREYNCYWLEDDELSDEFRPDRIGIVVTESGTIRVRDDELPVLRLNQSHAGACRREKARELIDGFVAGGAAVLLLCGPDLQILHDRARYPAITAQEIEVAFRYEQSQDADELKRLGAVSNDYRALTRVEAESSVSRERDEP